MKKSTKSALAAGAAAVLLTGGAGTLAYWVAEDTVNGGQIEAGNISLTVEDCQAVDWVYATGNASAGEPVTEIVPGDTIEKTCTGMLDGDGDNLRATVEVDPDSVPEAIFGNEELTVTAEVTDNAGPVDVDGPTTVEFTLTVKFPYGGPVSTPDPTTGADNASQNQTATLDGIRVIAVQVDPNA